VVIGQHLLTKKTNQSVTIARLPPRPHGGDLAVNDADQALLRGG